MEETEKVSTTSSKFLQNIGFGTLHIIAEVVALVGVSYYFFNKNKILMKHIEEIAQRLEEQDEILSKHEAILKKLTTPRPRGGESTLQPPMMPQKVEIKIKPQPAEDLLTPSTIVPVPPPVEPSITEVEDLDGEIQQELSELA